MFVDFGAVPTDGYSGDALRIQELVRDLRRRYVPVASLVIAISELKPEGVVRLDAGGAVRTLLLGDSGRYAVVE